MTTCTDHTSDEATKKRRPFYALAFLILAFVLIVEILDEPQVSVLAELLPAAKVLEHVMGLRLDGPFGPLFQSRGSR